MNFILNKPWQQPEITAINRLPMRPALFPYKNRAQALQEQPVESPWFKSLNGSWDFSLFDDPESCLEFVGDYIDVKPDDSDDSASFHRRSSVLARIRGTAFLILFSNFLRPTKSIF